MNAAELEVQNLSVTINGKKLLKDISFSVKKGEKVGFIGGSGSGKTLTALAVCGLLPQHAQVSGSIKLSGLELTNLTEKELTKIRGDQIGMVFQEPKTALNPLRKLGAQMTEALTSHYSLSRTQRKDEALELAKKVGLSNPARIINSYPHEVSGGQRQRAAIAAAISANPGMLFADEPTTALDVTIQKGILDLFNKITSDENSSLVFITHDLAVLAQVVTKIYVFHDGSIIESGSLTQITTDPRTSITKELLLAGDSKLTDELLESFLSQKQTE